MISLRTVDACDGLVDCCEAILFCRFRQRINWTDRAINITTKNFPRQLTDLVASAAAIYLVCLITLFGKRHRLFNLWRKGLCHFQVFDSQKPKCLVCDK